MSQQDAKQKAIRDYPAEQKQEWFRLYAEQKKIDPHRTISDFLLTLPENARPANATMGRIVHRGLEKKWPGWEEINGRCLKHPKIILKGDHCEVCSAENIIKLRDPEAYQRMKSDALAAKFYPTLKDTDPLKQFIASDLPPASYVEYFASINPNFLEPETHCRHPDDPPNR